MAAVSVYFSMKSATSFSKREQAEKIRENPKKRGVNFFFVFS